MDNTFFNSTDLLRIVSRWKKHLIIVAIISLAGSIIFSSPYFIKPKYKSFALVYPSNLIAYSTESATEQMLQVTQSYDIRDKIIRTFNLFEHYGIDTTRAHSYRAQIYKMYDENITIKKTEYESMEITAYDTDPVIASQIVDSIIHYFNLKARELQVSKSKEVLIIAIDQLKIKKAEMDSMENKVHEYSTQYGLLDYKSQSKEVTRAYMRGLSTGNGKVHSETNKIWEGLKDKGSEFNALNEHLWRIRGTYNDLVEFYDNAYRDVHKKLTYANIITKPFPSDKKAYPIRWLIVVIAVGTSLLIAFMVLMVIDLKKKNHSGQAAAK
jgi:capsule polysaccharide export protein KpsE/RkpR